jgi:hypothetical protein
MLLIISHEGNGGKEQEDAMPMKAELKSKLGGIFSEQAMQKLLPGWENLRWEEYGPYHVLSIRKDKETLRIGFCEAGSGQGYYTSAHGFEVAMLGDSTAASEGLKSAFEAVVRFFLDNGG